MHDLLLWKQLHYQLLLKVQRMNQPPILSIKMVPTGVELVLKALGKFPIEEAGPLFQEIKGQAEYQLQELQRASESTAAPTPSPDAENAPIAPADPIPATATQGE